MIDRMTRRNILKTAGTGLVLAGASPLLGASPRVQRRLPRDFLWGAATAGHQVEGGNINSDSWVSEHLSPSSFPEPSGDACDSWNRWREDIALVKRMGLNTYRFGIEWSRIEPARGEWSLASLAHYRAMVDTCLELGLKPIITFSHFTVPRWFAGNGGWENPESAELFGRFCETAARALGTGYGHALTFNEPNLAAQLSWQPEFRQAMKYFAMGNQQAAKMIGSDRFASTLTSDPAKTLANTIAAHHRGREAIKSVHPSVKIGLSLAVADEQALPGESALQRKTAEVYQPWFDAVAQDDFVGVQTYGRAVVGPDADIPPPAGAEVTQTGMEFYPEALEVTVKWVAEATGRPIIVTENGVATNTDDRRIAYIDRALAGLGRAMDAGTDVRGYIHWSLLDNFEWNRAYTAQFGLVAVDRKTFARTIKPSGPYLGRYARTNKI
ncbi:family 1 glycosylhydrolase [Novosphingobium sp. ST904]|uniref:glycoside hydrolase family 1 protein n=1 Tax=Novosphingobium sp. ST904 TaxID=1684385 RepID=UPI000AF74729|nr:family 1 glycosylhydrolase [Novosphingobium sp. ST904]TCM23833.1 aryl-beta-glucosidase [Novosphingobium sp. ST904]